MDDLLERLQTARDDDHERGCQMRFVVCSCGYDDQTARAVGDAKDRIEALTQQLEKSERNSDAKSRTIDVMVDHKDELLAKLAERDDAHAAGRAAERAEETGWLIEHADEPKWLTLRPGEACFEVCWTKASLEALRFARRTDAEDYVSTYFGGDGPIRITEHIWSDAIERGQHGSKGDE